MKKMAAVVRAGERPDTGGWSGRPAQRRADKQNRMRVEWPGGVGCGGQNCTDDLRGMNPTSYCCSTPRIHGQGLHPSRRRRSTSRLMRAIHCNRHSGKVRPGTENQRPLLMKE